MTQQESKVIAAMETFGGSFVKALANCFRKADHINFERLKEAFSEYWEKYTDMSKNL